MNARVFQTSIDHSAMGPDAADDSKSLITMIPDDQGFAIKQNAAFEKAFIQTLKGEAEGALTSYLFYDLPQDSNDRVFGSLPYDAEAILSGGRAWERRINEQAAAGLAPAGSFESNDKKIIDYALSHSLLQHLPEKLQLVSYGGGDNHAFRNNEGRIIHAIRKNNPDQIADFCSVDILPRFVHNLTYIASQEYGLTSQGVRGDFMRNGRLAINRSKGTPVVMIFGGSFENVATDVAHPDAEINAAIAWGKMNRQHGIGSIVIKSFDSDQNPRSQESKYAPTRNFEAFELSGFARAAVQGIITNPQYDTLEHWRLKTEFDNHRMQTRMMAECKAAHTIKTNSHGSFSFAKGEKLAITLSHKWEDAVHVRAAQLAGGKVLDIYSQPGNPNKLMVVQFVDDVAPQIKNFILY